MTRTKARQIVARLKKRRRANPLDPFTTIAAAASIAWNLAISRDLAKMKEKLGEKRANPTAYERAAGALQTLESMASAGMGLTGAKGKGYRDYVQAVMHGGRVPKAKTFTEAIGQNMAAKDLWRYNPSGGYRHGTRKITAATLEPLGMSELQKRLEELTPQVPEGSKKTYLTRAAYAAGIGKLLKDPQVAEMIRTERRSGRPHPFLPQISRAKRFLKEIPTEHYVKAEVDLFTGKPIWPMVGGKYVMTPEKMALLERRAKEERIRESRFSTADEAPFLGGRHVIKKPIAEEEILEELLGAKRSTKAKAAALAKKYFSKNPTLLVATNPGPDGHAINPALMRDPKFRAALKKYREFFGDDPVEITRVTDAPKGIASRYKYLVGLGKAPEVTYAPHKDTPKGKGPPFMHEWETKPFLALSPDEKFLGYLGRGKGYKVKREGIHG